jgi:stage II sporulation protein D
MNLKSTLVRFKFIENNDNKSRTDIPKLLSTNKLENEPLTHIVRVGDTLIVIADQYDVSVEEIVALNNIKNSSLINVGQRLLVPRNSLNSSFSSDRVLVVSGYGSGHGVGMSQWGAKYMANKGEKAKSILKHFYKGVEIKPFKKYFL